MRVDAGWRVGTGQDAVVPVRRIIGTISRTGRSCASTAAGLGSEAVLSAGVKRIPSRSCAGRREPCAQLRTTHWKPRLLPRDNPWKVGVARRVGPSHGTPSHRGRMSCAGVAGSPRATSSSGRAPQWHCGGAGFESPVVHPPCTAMVHRTSAEITPDAGPTAFKPDGRGNRHSRAARRRPLYRDDLGGGRGAPGPAKHAVPPLLASGAMALGPTRRGARVAACGGRPEGRPSGSR